MTPLTIVIVIISAMPVAIIIVSVFVVLLISMKPRSSSPSMTCIFLCKAGCLHLQMERDQATLGKVHGLSTCKSVSMGLDLLQMGSKD